jgi:hypothetical protein
VNATGRSVAWRWFWLVLAIVWTSTATVFITLDHSFSLPPLVLGTFGGHAIGPAVGARIVGGHVLSVSRPAQTLLQKDAVSVEIILTSMWLAVLVGVVELSLRTRLKSGLIGGAAISAGLLLIAFSLFGLWWGLMGIGPTGVVLILSGQRFNPRQHTTNARSQSIATSQ